jgi:uncharacterized protein (TIGR00369 family)
MLRHMARMNTEQLEAFIDEHFAAAKGYCQIVTLSEDQLVVKMPFRPDMLRPGGTISGPALMGLADVAAYYLVLSQAGPVMAVTSNLNINFLRRPEPQAVLATTRMLKLGRQLAVCEVHMSSAESGTLVAQATVTYALPSAT